MNRIAWKHARKAVKIELILLFVLTIITGAYIYHDYHERPGLPDRDAFRAVERGTDHIDLAWDHVRNTEEYKVFYREDGNTEDGWTMEVVGGDSNTYTIDGLKEDTTYVFVLRPDNSKRRGIKTQPKRFATKKNQNVETEKNVTKLTSSKPFTLDVEASTAVSYEVKDKKVAVVDEKTGKIKVKGEGTTEITVTAEETKDYVGDSTKVKLRVIAAEPVNAGGASARIIYHLDSSNCEAVKAVTGYGGIHVPQGLAYTGDKYIIAYGMSGSQRIISFDVDGDSKNVVVPGIALGHPNGFTYNDDTGLCYCVKGWSGRCVTYSPENGSFDVIKFPYGCSGIGYDREKKLMYTSSRTAMVAYSMKDGIEIAHRTGVVRHSSKMYTQDCGGYGGIMLHCLSGSSKHGINYIDMYDMINGKYLGTFSCDLSEVESVIIDKDGFLEILANNTSRVDYIWKTNINIATIAEGL